MKKICIFILFFLITSTHVFADSKNHTTAFNGEKYYLLYSTKNPDFGGYLNEYYKRGETYNIWSEMVAVHHFPNAYSPIDQVKQFKEYLQSIGCPSSLSFDDKRNSALIDFILINDTHLPVVLEFNVFKYQKSEKCGSIAFQYTKRYSAANTLDIEAIKKEFEKNRLKMVKKVLKHKIPVIIFEEIDKCKLPDSDINVKNTGENDIQKVQEQSSSEDNTIENEVTEITEEKTETPDSYEDEQQQEEIQQELENAQAVKNTENETKDEVSTESVPDKLEEEPDVITTSNLENEKNQEINVTESEDEQLPKEVEKEFSVQKENENLVPAVNIIEIQKDDKNTNQKKKKQKQEKITSNHTLIFDDIDENPKEEHTEQNSNYEKKIKRKVKKQNADKDILQAPIPKKESIQKINKNTKKSKKKRVKDARKKILEEE